MTKNKRLAFISAMLLVVAGIFFFTFKQYFQPSHPAKGSPPLASQAPGPAVDALATLEASSATGKMGVHASTDEKPASVQSPAAEKLPQRQLKSVKNDIYSKFMEVHRGDLQEEMQKQRALYEATRDADAAYELSRLYRQCAETPKDREGFEQWMQNSSTRWLEMGKSNGEILAAQSRWEKSYTECKKVSRNNDAHEFEQEALEFLQEAAFSGNTNAVYQMATTDAFQYLAKGRGPEEVSQLKNDIGELLLSARASCDPHIFSVLAHGRGKGINWALDINAPEAGFAWAHHWTMAAINLRVLEHSDEARKSYSEGLRTLEQKYAMSEGDIQLAKKNGQRYFKSFCTEKITENS